MAKSNKQFPQELFIVREEEQVGSHYFLVSENANDCDIRTGETRLVATYQLVATRKVVKKVSLIEVV